MIAITGPHLEQGPNCSPILRSLPAWFGIESATQHYIDAIDSLPTFLAILEDRLPACHSGDHAEDSLPGCQSDNENVNTLTIGFLSIKQHFPHSAEIYVTGILPDYHRQGIGRALLTYAETWLREQDVRYLQVKTLSASHPDPGYARTRAFYIAMDFTPLEEFPDLWEPSNPCLLLVKAL